MNYWITKLEFTYWWKSFWCREMTVWDYYLYLKDPDYLIEKKLSEWWKKVILTNSQLRRFLKILLDWKTDDNIATIMKKKSDKKAENTLKDLHIFIWMISNILHSECLSLPLEMFWKIVKDLDVITWKETYDPMRNEKTIDSKALMEFTGWKKKL